MITCTTVVRTGATALAAMTAWGALALGPATARANPASLVPSAGDPGYSLNLFLWLDYAYEVDSALIAREAVGTPAAGPAGAVPVQPELDFHQSRHVLTPRAELAVFHDTWVSMALPIVIGQARELELANGVTRASSSTLADGLLPMQGFDARDPSAPPPGDLVFRGVSRSGLDQLHLGLNIAPMNQRRDPTKPTWKLGGELRLSIGDVMKLDAMAPGTETGVSSGVHELRLWTSFARKNRWMEGWVELFWQAPIGARSTSLFQHPGFGVTNDELAQQAGVSFGAEAYALDDKLTGNQISIDLGARIVGHFEGRDYSEMWEVFAFAGDSRGSGPLILDRDPTAMGVQAMSHPGISNVENYLETAGQVAVRAALGKNVRFAALLDLAWKTDHVISFADAGIDLPTCGSGSGPCETDMNDLVNPGTTEVNPLHVSRIDLVGHRYLSLDNFGLTIGVEGKVLF